jgi:hypothetical protein
MSVTYDHRLRRIGHPVRSAIHKPQIGRLVVGWVTTSEYLLLYVFAFLPLEMKRVFALNGTFAVIFVNFNVALLSFLPFFRPCELVCPASPPIPTSLLLSHPATEFFLGRSMGIARVEADDFLQDSFKLQSHAMYLDTSYNSTSTVLTNIYTSFLETATKMWTYARCLPVGKQPGTNLLIKTITDLIEMAYVLVKSKGKNKRNVGYQCGVKKMQVEYMALNAFRNVLRKKQSKYGKVIEWLDEKICELRGKEADSFAGMKGIIQASC